MTTLCGVVGWPVAHSRSPAMHNAAYAALGMDWNYLALPVEPDLFAETVRALPGSGYRGINVTVPHKVAALALADEASAAAREIGASNSLRFDADGWIVAENTDAGGFIDALGEQPAGRTALVLGAGGAARAIVYALREAGAAEVRVWNRTPERARELAADLGVSVVESPGAADILVNSTTVGLDRALPAADAIEALGLADLDPPPIVVDLLYGEGDSPVCAWARRGGAQVFDGLEMLVGQGARSFEDWTGREAPIDVMRAAARGVSR
ncbi:MAG: shikimate dehydrogenase [Thermoleophilaceae bacterium]|nr:shikimate dehydrogenase [Thermoleophilaceae bacterium]